MRHLFIACILPLVLGACQAEQATPPAINTSASVSYSERPVPVPVPFAKDIVSTDSNNEFHLAFSPDGKTVYFSRRAPGEKQQILTATFEEGTWTQPVVTPFSTARDEAPFITTDGRTLYFGSERPIPGRPSKGNFDMNIWRVERGERGWLDPVPLPAPINEVQEEGEEWPSSNASFMFSLDDSTYYFTTMVRGSRAIALYETYRGPDGFSVPRKVDGLFEDDRYWVNGAVISPDGEYLVFNSYQAPGGAGGEDIYVARRMENGWSQAVAIGGLVNTPAEEGNPQFSRDGAYFFFSREVRSNPDEDGIWSIYFVDTGALALGTLFDSP